MLSTFFLSLFPFLHVDYIRLTSRTTSYPLRQSTRYNHQRTHTQSMSIFSDTHLTFIQQHASNILPSPPSPNLFTLPSPFDPNRPIHRPYKYHPANDSCSISSIELRPLMKRDITPAVLASSSDHCRLPSLQNMLASPPPEDRPSNTTTTSSHNNTHASVTSFQHDQQPITSHLVKRSRSYDDHDTATVIIHQQPQHDVFTQKKPKHRHHDDTRGLRHFSKQVCDTVARKGITTYNEVLRPTCYREKRMN